MSRTRTNARHNRTVLTERAYGKTPAKFGSDHILDRLAAANLVPSARLGGVLLSGAVPLPATSELTQTLNDILLPSWKQAVPWPTGSFGPVVIRRGHAPLQNIVPKAAAAPEPLLLSSCLFRRRAVKSQRFVRTDQSGCLAAAAEKC